MTIYRDYDYGEEKEEEHYPSRSNCESMTGKHNVDSYNKDITSPHYEYCLNNPDNCRVASHRDGYCVVVPKNVKTYSDSDKQNFFHRAFSKKRRSKKSRKKSRKLRKKSRKLRKKSRKKSRKSRKSIKY